MQTVGSKLSNRAFVKEVVEEDWKDLNEKDKYRNKLFQCLKCGNAKRVRAQDRKTHRCD